MLLEFRYERRQADTHRYAERPQFKHIKPPFAPLAFGNERLGRTELFRQLLLRQTLTFPDTMQKFQEMSVFDRVDSLGSCCFYFHAATPNKGAAFLQPVME